MKISPIFYMGNKKKLIKSGLIDLFPDNINTFVDLFGGSGVVSLNVKSNKVILNDIDENLNKLYNMFVNYDPNDIINHINNNIIKFNLPKIRTRRNEFFDKEAIEIYKNGYSNLRNHFNKNRYILDFYTLMFFSFSQQFRFNNKGEFNMPFGNDCFTDKNSDYIIESNSFFKSKNTIITRYDFRVFKELISSLKSDDFVYLDPPYFNSTAVYNENGGWSENDESDLLSFCEELNNSGIKFGMSNVFSCKGNTNKHLIDWCDKIILKYILLKNNNIVHVERVILMRKKFIFVIID